MINLATVVLLYAGPDQILPLVSVLGGLLGMLLIGWQRVVGIIRRVFSRFRRSDEEVAPALSQKIETGKPEANLQSSAKQ